MFGAEKSKKKLNFFFKFTKFKKKINKNKFFFETKYVLDSDSAMIVKHFRVYRKTGLERFRTALVQKNKKIKNKLFF
jgi:hypothetical protein